MLPSVSIGSLRFVAASALFSSLLCASEGQSRPRLNMAHPKGSSAATGEVKVKEAEILVAAYVVMAGADHTYDGHRAHSMESVKKAIDLADELGPGRRNAGEKQPNRQQG